MIFDSSNGDLLKSIYEEESGSILSRTVVGLEMNGGTIYVVHTDG